MARIRSIKEDLFLDDGLSEVSLEAHFLLAGLPVLADREGRLEDRPRRIHAQVFPYRPRVDVDACLRELVTTRHIRRYAAGGTNYIQISDWENDQRPHVNEPVSRIPSPLDDYTEHRHSGVPGFHESKPATHAHGDRAGIKDSGLGILDLGLGDPPASQAPLPIGEPGHGKTKPRTKPDKQPDPRHAPLLKSLCDEVGFPINGGRDAKAVAQLLALADQREATRDDLAGPEVLRRARIGWVWAGFPACKSLTELVSHWGHYEKPQDAQGTPSRQQEVWNGLQGDRRAALEQYALPESAEMASPEWILKALEPWAHTHKGDTAISALRDAWEVYAAKPQFQAKGLPVKLFLSPGVLAECVREVEAEEKRVADLSAGGVR